MVGRGIAFAGLLVACALSGNVSAAVEGYGAATAGETGGDIYHVTSLADSGPGTLRDGVLNRSGPRTVVFDVGGAITLASNIVISRPYLTIDGSTAPSPGIEIRKKTVYGCQLIIGGTHDIIITHLRFRGLWQIGGLHDTGAGTVEIDGDSGPDHIARNIVLDHLTSLAAGDGGPDIWGAVENVTVSWCLLYENWGPMIVSHYPDYMVRRNLSIHHNVYARNGERNPQIRADVRNLDFVNNIVYGWGYKGNPGYGTRIRSVKGEPKVNANIINNCWLPLTAPAQSLVYGDAPGPDGEEGGPSTTLPQGTVYQNSRLGDLYVSGNHLPPENRDHYSTVAEPLATPSWARVTTQTVDLLGQAVLPHVGMRYRLPGEQSVLDEIAAVMGITLGCDTDTECDDGVYCNGAETCSTGSCIAGTPPCIAGQCDEGQRICAGCLGDTECDDGLFCNGTETCINGNCTTGTPPCGLETCDEDARQCVPPPGDGGAVVDPQVPAVPPATDAPGSAPDAETPSAESSIPNDSGAPADSLDAADAAGEALPPIGCGAVGAAPMLSLALLLFRPRRRTCPR